MKSIVVVGILSVASVARAERPKMWARPVTHLAGAPGGAPILVLREPSAHQQYVLDQRDDAYQVVVYGLGARLALWVSAADVVPSVTREVGVAATATGHAPGPDDDGLFVRPGVQADGERRGDRVHVTIDDHGAPIEGWIDAAAVGATFVQSYATGDDWTSAPAGTKIVSHGRAIAFAREPTMARKLPHGRGELMHDDWFARGTLILPKRKSTGAAADDVDGVEGGVEGGVVGGVARDPLVPDGTCLFDDDGHQVGFVDGAALLDRAVRTKDGYVVDVSIIGVDGAQVRLFAHLDGAKVVMCPVPTP